MAETLATLRRRVSHARVSVQAEIMSNSKGGMYSAGLASEGYAGGYRDALDDVIALLNGNRPSDARGYWAED